MNPFLFRVGLDKFGVQDQEFSLFSLLKQKVLEPLEFLLVLVGSSDKRLENRNLDLVLFLKVRNSNSYLQSTGVGWSRSRACPCGGTSLSCSWSHSSNRSGMSCSFCVRSVRRLGLLRRYFEKASCSKLFSSRLNLMSRNRSGFSSRAFWTSRKNYGLPTNSSRCFLILCSQQKCCAFRVGLVVPPRPFR